MANMAYHRGTEVNPRMVNRRSVLSSGVRSLQAKGWWAMDDKVKYLRLGTPRMGNVDKDDTDFLVC